VYRDKVTGKVITAEEYTEQVRAVSAVLCVLCAALCVACAVHILCGLVTALCVGSWSDARLRHHCGGVHRAGGRHGVLCRAKLAVA
jgi:hypothetical protein